MTKCNENFSPDYRKGGYLKVGRNVMKAAFGKDKEQRHLAQVLLCVQTFAYFREGVVCLNEFSYVCRPGEWITSLSEVSGLTGLCRKTVKKCLTRLEAGGYLRVTELVNYKLITLNNYEQMIPASSGSNQPSSPAQPVAKRVDDNLFSQAMNFYNLNSAQEGGVN